MKGRRKADAKGRNSHRLGSDGALVMFRRSFWQSPQVAALDPLERTLIVELTALYTGPKPVADVFLGVRDAARRCGVADYHAVVRAFETLKRLGFITEVVAGSFAVKGGSRSKARGWRLNWKALDGGQRGADALPALDFAELTPKQRKRVAERSAALNTYRKNNFSVGESTTLASIRAGMLADSVGESTTLSPEKRSFASPSTVGESTTHIYYQGGRGIVGVRQSAVRTSWANENGPVPFLAGASQRFCDLVKLRAAQGLVA